MTYCEAFDKAVSINANTFHPVFIYKSGEEYFVMLSWFYFSAAVLIGEVRRMCPR